jgi:hypothetical protein
MARGRVTSVLRPSGVTCEPSGERRNHTGKRLTLPPPVLDANSHVWHPSVSQFLPSFKGDTQFFASSTRRKVQNGATILHDPCGQNSPLVADADNRSGPPPPVVPSDADVLGGRNRKQKILGGWTVIVRCCVRACVRLSFLPSVAPSVCCSVFAEGGNDVLHAALFVALVRPCLPSLSHCA